MQRLSVSSVRTTAEMVDTSGVGPCAVAPAHAVHAVHDVHRRPDAWRQGSRNPEERCRVPGKRGVRGVPGCFLVMLGEQNRSPVRPVDVAVVAAAGRQQ